MRLPAGRQGTTYGTLRSVISASLLRDVLRSFAIVMLPKPNRLPSPDIRIVLRRGRRVSNDYVQLVFLPNHVHRARFAFVVSTGLDKRATARNRVKRLLREAVRKALPQVQKGVDAILIARSKQLITNEDTIADRVDALLLRAQLL